MSRVSTRFWCNYASVWSEMLALRPILLALLLPCVLAVTACNAPRTTENEGFRNTVIDHATFGRDFQLNDPQGKPRRLADFRGKVVVIFFGYTHCPDVCPTTLATMAEVMRQLGQDATRVQVLFVTLDPARDTRELLAAYVPQFHPDFVGLTGDAAAINATAREFRIYHQQRPGSSEGDYSIDHSTGSYLIDLHGRLRLWVKHGTTPEPIAADIRRLLAGD